MRLEMEVVPVVVVWSSGVWLSVSRVTTKTTHRTLAKSKISRVRVVRTLLQNLSQRIPIRS